MGARFVRPLGRHVGAGDSAVDIPRVIRQRGTDADDLSEEVFGTHSSEPTASVVAIFESWRPCV